MYSWNEAINKMNKENDFKNLIYKLHELWSNNRLHMVLLYADNGAIGFDNLKGIKGVISHIRDNKVTSIYVRTPYDSYKIDITKYQRYQHLKDIDTLVIFEYDKQINIKL